MIWLLLLLSALRGVGSLGLSSSSLELLGPDVSFNFHCSQLL